MSDVAIRDDADKTFPEKGDDSSRRTPPLIYRKKHAAGLNIFLRPNSTFTSFDFKIRPEQSTFLHFAIFQKWPGLNLPKMRKSGSRVYSAIRTSISQRSRTPLVQSFFDPPGLCEIKTKEKNGIFGYESGTFRHIFRILNFLPNDVKYIKFNK